MKTTEHCWTLELLRIIATIGIEGAGTLDRDKATMPIGPPDKLVSIAIDQVGVLAKQLNRILWTISM